MKTFKFSTKKRGPKGEGRAVVYKPVQLPVELIEELKLYKDAYGLLLAKERDEWGNPIPVHVTFAEMLTRWMENVKSFDKSVQNEVDEYRRIRIEAKPTTSFYVDPTDGDVWDLNYSAWRNGDNYPLTVDDKLAFYAVIDGKIMDAEQLINEEYELENEAGVILNLEQVRSISAKIIEHNKSIL